MINVNLGGLPAVVRLEMVIGKSKQRCTVRAVGQCIPFLRIILWCYRFIIRIFQDVIDVCLGLFISLRENMVSNSCFLHIQACLTYDVIPCHYSDILISPIHFLWHDALTSYFWSLKLRVNIYALTDDIA